VLHSLYDAAYVVPSAICKQEFLHILFGAARVVCCCLLANSRMPMLCGAVWRCVCCSFCLIYKLQTALLPGTSYVVVAATIVVHGDS
jgi:hypothetical protein